MDLFAPFRKWVNPRLWKKYIDFLNKDKSQTVQLTFLDGTVVVADEFKEGDCDSITYYVDGDAKITARKEVKRLELVRRKSMAVNDACDLSGVTEERKRGIPYKKGVGTVTMWNNERSFGFLVDKNETFFFSINEIMDERLQNSLENRELRQRVTYETTMKQPTHGKYPMVRVLTICDDEHEDPEIHRAAGHAAMIKGDLVVAEKEFLKVLSNAHPGTSVHLRALRDLAETWNRTDPLKAYELIEKYRAKYGAEEEATFDRMEISYLERLGRVEDVIKKIDSLLARDISSEQRDFYSRKKNRLQNSDVSMRNPKLSKNDSEDMPLIRHPLFVESLDNCKLYGLEKQTVVPQDTGYGELNSYEELPEDLDLLDRLMGELDHAVIGCAERYGLIDRKDAAKYISDDYSREQLRLQMTRIALTLRKGDWKQFKSSLRNYLFRVAQLSMFSESERNMSRAICYLILTGRQSPENHTFWQSVLPRLILGLCAGYDEHDLRKIIEDVEFSKTVGFSEKIDEDACRKFANLVSEYSLQTIFPRLEEFVKLPENVVIDATSRYDKIVERCIGFCAIPLATFADADKFLTALGEDLMRNKQEIDAVRIFIRECRQYETMMSFEDKVNAFNRIAEQRRIFHQRYVIDEPTLPTFDMIYPILDVCWRKVYDLHSEILSKPVDIVLAEGQSVLAIPEGSRARISVKIRRDATTPRIKNLVMSVDDQDHGVVEDEKGTDVYDGELTEDGHVFSIAFEPTAKEIEDGGGLVGVRVSYVEQDGYSNNDSRMLQVRFAFDKFEPIVNPYNETGDMALDNLFVGRAEELHEIVDVLSRGKGGRCFVLYGPRRSGKSSILEKLSDSKSVAYFSSDRFVYTKLNAFLWNAIPGDEENYDLLHCLAENVNRQLGAGLMRPSVVRGIEISWLEGIAKKINDSGKVWIIGIDEFTRPYLDWCQEKVNYLDRQRIATFLKTLRGLLGAHLFHLILIGQECMLQFEDEFPNEFAVTTNRRLSYLTKDETLQLIEEPIRNGSKSRFASEEILKQYLALTGGYPYYAQIICYRIVQIMNNLKCSQIDESVLNKVVLSLCDGSGRLRGRDFDPFVDLLHPDFTVRDTSLLYYDIVENMRNGQVMIDRYKGDDGMLTPLFRLMMDRDILEKISDSSVRIRSGLFEQWLKKNEGMIG